MFFITTANTLDTIPRPLLDRMEVMRLAGYSEEEKIEIAKRYLVPRQLKEAGLTAEQLTLPDETLRRIIRRYTREAGVRELERTLGPAGPQGGHPLRRGHRPSRSRVQPDDLAELLGPERFFLEQARRELPPGVATGLAWTEAGGDVLYIEASLLPERQGPHADRPAGRSDAGVGQGRRRVTSGRKPTELGIDPAAVHARPACTSTCRPARCPRTGPRPAWQWPPRWPRSTRSSASAATRP